MRRGIFDKRATAIEAHNSRYSRGLETYYQGVQIDHAQCKWVQVILHLSSNSCSDE